MTVEASGPGGRETVAFVGLGAMGAGMARRLLGAGFAVRGHDVDPAAGPRLVADGGESAPTPAAAAAGCRLLLVCVFSAEQAESVLFGPEGAAGALAPGATVLMHTTMSPRHVERLAARLEDAGIALVDAPVTGGKAGADAGTLTIIASGTPEAMAAAAGAFAAMGERVYRVGERPGAAATVKMVNQLLVGVHVAAAAEAIALAARAGADPATAYDVITHGAGSSLAFKTRVPHILARDFAPRGVVDILLKDLGIVTETAAALAFDAPLAQAALAQFRAAAAAGLGRADDAAVVKVYEARSHVDVAGAAGRAR